MDSWMDYGCALGSILARCPVVGGLGKRVWNSRPLGTGPLVSKVTNPAELHAKLY